MNHTVCSWESTLISSWLKFLAKIQTVTFDSVWYHSCLNISFFILYFAWELIYNYCFYLIFGGWTGIGGWTGSFGFSTGSAGFSISVSTGLGAEISFWHLAINSTKRYCIISLFFWASFKPCSKASNDFSYSFRLNRAVLD